MMRMDDSANLDEETCAGDLVVLEDGEARCPRVYSFAHNHDPFSRVTLSIDIHKNLVCKNQGCKRFCRHCAHIHRLQSLMDVSDGSDERSKLRQVLGNVRIVGKMLVMEDEPTAVDPQAQHKSTMSKPTLSISKQRICPSTASSHELKRKNPLHPSPWLPACTRCQLTGETCTHCVPDADGQCDRCGSDWKDGDPVQRGWLRQRHATLLGCQGAVQVSTYYRPCLGCDAQKPFDGHDVGIFNFSDSTLFLHELLFQYLDSMVHSKTTFTGYYSMLEDQYARSGCSALLRSRRVFGYVWNVICF